MRKKLLILLGTLLICMTFTMSAFAAPIIILDSKQISFEIPPIIENGRTLVPLYTIFKVMGADLLWDADTNTATGIKGDTTIKLTMKSATPTINDITCNLDVPGRMNNGIPLAPLRFVCEAYGTIVNWEEATQIITISSPPTEIQNSPIHPPSGKAPSFPGYLGSINSKEYHRLDCNYVYKLTPEEIVFFYSKEAGEAAGYVPCKLCCP